MGIMHNYMVALLIVTFFLGDAACLCALGSASGAVPGAGEAVIGPDRSHMNHHAHGESSDVATDERPCPHVDCDGDCAVATALTADMRLFAHFTSGFEPEGPEAATRAILREAPLPRADVRLRSLYSPQLRSPASPVSRFDRLLD